MIIVVAVAFISSDRSPDHHSSLLFRPSEVGAQQQVVHTVGHKDRSLSRKRQKRQEQQQLGSGSGGRWWRGIRREGVTQSARKKEREGGRVIKHFSSTISSLIYCSSRGGERERNGFYKHAHERERETLLVYNHHPPSSVIVTGRVKRDFSSPLPPRTRTPTMELYGAERSQRRAEAGLIETALSFIATPLFAAPPLSSLIIVKEKK